MRWECRERFLRHRLQIKLLFIDPGMHHGTCVTHVPWCMSGSLTGGGGENVPGIPGACATRNFAYLIRGPYDKHNIKSRGFVTSQHIVVRCPPAWWKCSWIRLSHYCYYSFAHTLLHWNSTIDKWYVQTYVIWITLDANVIEQFSFLQHKPICIITFIIHVVRDIKWPLRLLSKYELSHV